MTTPDQMPAGPELDRLIAEKVMGWQLNPDNSDAARGVFCYTSGFIVRPQRHDMRDWRPCMNIDQAWEVAEKMKIGVLPAMGDIGWVAGFEGPGACSWPENYAVGMPEGLRTWAEAPTAPLAICRAALKAVTTNV